MKKVIWFFLLLVSGVAYGQVFNDISSVVNLRYNGLDSVRLMGGIAAFDFDNDGDDDLLLTSAETAPRLYRNDGDFDFTDVTGGSGLDTLSYNIAAMAAADFDNDGWQDLLLTTIEGQPNLLLRNNQDGSFANLTEQSGIGGKRLWGMAVALGDFNDDSYLDIYIGNYAEERKRDILPTPPVPNEFFLSQGAPFQYVEQAGEKGVTGNGYTLSARFMDFDGDRDLDLYVANDFGTGGQEPNLYYENMDGQLVERSRDYGLWISANAMGIGYGDFDNDQDFDIYVSDIGANFFLENEQNGFRDVAANTFTGGNFTSWGGHFMDVNNDGLLDLTMTNGSVLDDQLAEPFVYYENLGGVFLDYRIPMADLPYYARGMAVSDFDGDGDEDIMVNTVIEKDTLSPQRIRVLENLTDIIYRRNNYLQVRLEAVVGNRDAIGAILKLTLDDGSVRTRTLDAGGTYVSVHTKTVHFGLGRREVQQLAITWPDGQEQVFEDIPHNEVLKIKQDEAPRVVSSGTVGIGDKALRSGIRISTPVRDEIRLFFDSPLAGKPADIDLWTMKGQLLNNWRYGGMDRSISLPVRLPPGAYVLRFRVENVVLTRRIIVQ